jgi:hypothetical protein
METQITATKLTELSVIKLYEHYRSLEQSMPLLTPESQVLCKSELEQTAELRSEKVDRIYYALAAHEDSLERVKKEQELLADAKKHHESNIKQLKDLVNWIRRSGAIKENRLVGKNYEFVLAKKAKLTVTISTDIKNWSIEEQKKFCIIEETTITKEVVIRSIDGDVLDKRTEPKTKTEQLPNLDELCNAYQNGQSIPNGVKVVQEYSIRSKRIVDTKRLDAEI